ncbi:hypothetical protein [Bifidobacterium sp. ESL0704]|uniref:hypothetical protein n=1 Tax=Bifidobacterium sp. ESL0704 TaxID=2983219 RepID=UPI0023F6C90E|nr:hypothetical protein [Bifidobacterium sp. ESL0704]WEV52242.1 hypothetical protein OZX64_04825 [Bifidobacterium sp. ESL0704]
MLFSRGIPVQVRYTNKEEESMWKKRQFYEFFIDCSSLLCAVAITLGFPPSAFAWGPMRETFTMEHPAPYPTLDSITDNPGWGDERNFLRVREDRKSASWSDVAEIRKGKTYAIRAYVRNASADNLNLDAENVKLAINLLSHKDSYRNYMEVNAALSGSNTQPEKIWDNIVIRGNHRFRIKVLSAKYYTNKHTYSTGGLPLSDEAFTYSGAYLGYDKMDGRVGTKGKDSGYALIRFTTVTKDSFTEWFEDHILNKLSGPMTGKTSSDETWENPDNTKHSSTFQNK